MRNWNWLLIVLLVACVVTWWLVIMGLGRVTGAW